MSSPADFYAAQLFELLNKLSQKMPLAIYPDNLCLSLDFSEFEGKNRKERYEIYKDIMENDAHLADFAYTEKVCIEVNDEKFFFVRGPYAKVGSNINKAGGMIFTLFR
jgi:hypothetical protein